MFAKQDNTKPLLQNNTGHCLAIIPNDVKSVVGGEQSIAALTCILVVRHCMKTSSGYHKNS